MSWSGLADNQCISFNNLQDAVNNGIFTAIASIPANDFQITKADANSKIVIPNANIPGYVNKTDSYLLVKSDLYAAGDITLSPQYGMYFTGISATGFPSFSYPVTTQQTLTYNSVVPDQVIAVSLNGTRIVTPLQIAVYINQQLIDCQAISTNGAQTKYFSIPATYAASPIRITIGSGGCGGGTPAPVFTNTSFSAVAVNRGSGQYMVVGNAYIGSSSGVYPGYLYRSSNYGASWTQVSITGYWQKIAMSDNGQYILALSDKVYLSSDYGALFTEVTSLGTASFTGGAISSNGQYQMIAANNINQYGDSCVYISNNYGVTWTTFQSSIYDTYSSCAINSDGSVFLLGGGVGGTSFIFRSTNQGSSWSSVYTAQYGSAVNDINITASNGWVLASNYGTAYNGFYLIRSNNSGASFTQINSQQSWMRTAINNTVSGLALYYLGGTGTSYIQQVTAAGPVPLGSVSNLNSSPVRNWHAIACSDNGTYILAGERYGLWLSTNGGSSFNQL